MAGLRAPHPVRVKRENARLRLALRPCGNYIWGFAPYPDSGTFLGKSPRDPKKPGRVRYRLSSIDREQGCRTAALLCVLFKLLLTYPAKVLKLQTYSFYQSISIFIVSLPNVSEKDVKGLLFRKQQGTDVDFWLYEIDKAIQTLSSVYRT